MKIFSQEIILRNYGIYSGGAHGMVSEYGATFDKKKGVMLRNVLSPKDVKALQPILRAGVESYFRGWYEKENDVESRVKEDMEGLFSRMVLSHYQEMVFVFRQRVLSLSMDSMRLVLMLSECLPLLFLIRRLESSFHLRHNALRGIK